MEVGSLVKYVGSAAMYRDRIGVIAQTYGFIDERIDSALVYFSGLEGKGRDAPGPAGPPGDGLHPMHFSEVEIINASR
jgi:hypothetical protein|tara:strand:+ start:441 stop:674 length:234 start_codon:yes stop_codon:yes gene_type:complete